MDKSGGFHCYMLLCGDVDGFLLDGFAGTTGRTEHSRRRKIDDLVESGKNACPCVLVYVNLHLK
jgi:hypothetical protein